MNKASKSLLAGIALCISIGVFSIKGTKENTVNPIINDISNLKIRDRITEDKYLNTFKEPSFSFARESASFSGSMPVYKLFDIRKAERKEVLEYDVNFNATYIKSLELGRVTVSLFGPKSEEPIMSESVYAYPFRDKKGNIDIEFFMNGFSFFSSEFMSDREIKDDKAYEISKISAYSAVSQSITLEKDYAREYVMYKGEDVVVNPQDDVKDLVETTTDKTTPESSGVVYPIVAITSTLLSIGFSTGLAYTLFPRPNFFLDGLAALALYEFKMTFAFIHYEHNKNLMIPHKANETEPYINSQRLVNGENYFHEPGENPNGFSWARWNYGFFDLRHSGCPVFAVYNMLVDSSPTKVDLATLTLLFELCNADIGFGGVGALPVDPTVAKTLTNLLLTAFEGIVIALMACLSLIPGVGWLVFLLGGLLKLVDTLVKAYIDNQRDLGAVLKVLNCNYLQGDFINRPGCAFDSFKKDLGAHRQGIVAYWHKLGDKSFLPNVGRGAHFVYVRNDVSIKNNYSVYNRYGDSTTFNANYGNEVSLVGSASDAEANEKTIGYYVIQ